MQNWFSYLIMSEIIQNNKFAHEKLLKYISLDEYPWMHFYGSILLAKTLS